MTDTRPISRRNILTIAGLSFGISPLLRAADGNEPSPRFWGKTMAGESFNNQTLNGKVVLVDFWATWCPYCRRDASTVDELTAEFQKDGLVVFAVNVGESKKTVKAYLDANPLKAKLVMMADTNLAAMFAATKYPYYVLIDGDGTVAGDQKGSGGERALRRLLRRTGLGVEDRDDSPIELQGSPRRG